MEISNRLKTIANFVPKNSIVADIGTDHGYIPIYLIRKMISKKVIATDISKASLNKTIQSIKGTKIEKKISTRLGNGLEVIKPFEVDTVIMAGMGGILIRDILEKDKDTAHSICNFILQPMVASKELREYLMDNNYEIVDEELVKEDGRFYEILYAKKGLAYIDDDIYLEIGKKLIEKQDPLLKEFLEYKILMIKEVLEKIKGAESLKTEERRSELNKSLTKYREVLRNIEGD